MNEATTPPAPATTQPLRIPWTILAAAAVLILAFAGLLLYQAWSANANQDAVISAIEEQYGLRVTMIGVTAGGGALDFRFQVVDPSKASNYLHGPTEDLPTLIVEDSGARIEAPVHQHTMTYQYGIVYYMLYGNPHGVVQPGTKVTAVFGDLRLKHIVAR
ncbi:MAG: hypothetical protein H6659_09795 [Ardenticatenaceae bacterium]|nr:hypothetical protein [Anaerolineales bacterium]MCB8984107.1 hypothetical protein [Ardenticatenaceae bacterium]MCB8987756.1 hypothetical protein [Ardenticatenaceae bacterium]